MCAFHPQNDDLPLHYAAKYGASDVVVALLLRLYPEGARQTNRVRLLCECSPSVHNQSANAIGQQKETPQYSIFGIQL